MFFADLVVYILIRRATLMHGLYDGLCLLPVYACYNRYALVLGCRSCCAQAVMPSTWWAQAMLTVCAHACRELPSIQ